MPCNCDLHQSKRYSTRGKQTLTQRATIEYRYTSNLKLYATCNLYCSIGVFLIISAQKRHENSTIPTQLAIFMNLKRHLCLTSHNSFSNSCIVWWNFNSIFLFKIWFEILFSPFLMLISEQPAYSSPGTSCSCTLLYTEAGFGSLKSHTLP